jgi:hypothetical protein
MFAFNPGVNDRSGEILGQAAVGAANTTAGAQQQMVSDIGSSLMSLAAAYGAKKGTEAKGKNFKKFMGMAGDTFGMDGAMFGDMEDYDAGMMLENFAPMMPAMANAQLGRGRMGVQQDQQQLTARQQQITAAAPATRAVATAAGRVASGQGTINRSAIGYNPAAIRRSNPTGP